MLEGREDLGGTWDLFRYPGIRSDSDMHTLGYAFKPWLSDHAIADGPDILQYLRETVEENGLLHKIRYGHKVLSASWSSADEQWTLQVQRAGSDKPEPFSCQFLQMCSGYYNYDRGYDPEFPGSDDFTGDIIHPQFWREDLDWNGRRVVVIGSGATAATIVPAMAKNAEHVTMLQRSPTYFASAPAKDRFANWLRDILPLRAAYFIARWKNILLQMYIYRFCQRRPETASAALINRVRDALGPEFDVDTHFTPRYDPWDQRLCLVPDSDFFEAMRRGEVSVVTDHISRFTADGIELKSGESLKADIIVKATGLELLFLAGIELDVDGVAVDPSGCYVYRGMMVEGVPNMTFTMGYTNASWTLKADLTAVFACRLLNHMTEHGYASCVPLNKDPELTAEPYLDFTSSYVTRALEQLPKQGSRAPWRLNQNYLLDMISLRFRRLADSVLKFS